MRTNRKKSIILALLILLLVLTIGYALISTQLKINGTATISKQGWRVYWTNPQVVEGSISNTVPTIGADTGNPANTKVSWSVSLELPGDFYEFTVDAVNAGTLNAMITGIETISTPSLPDYITYRVTNSDGSPIEENHVLGKARNNIPRVEKYRIRVEYDEEKITSNKINKIPEGGNNYKFTVGITYVQTDTPGSETNASGPYKTGKIASCPNCVFAFYYDEKYYSADNEYERSTLTDYTDNYTTLKEDYYRNSYTKVIYETLDDCTNALYSNQTEEEEECGTYKVQRLVFLGHILDSNDKIIKGFTCAIKDYDKETEEPFCIEGFKPAGDDYSSIYEANNTLLQSSSLWNNSCNYAGFGTLNCASTNEDYHLEANSDISGAVSTQSDEYKYDDYIYSGGIKNSYCGVSYIGNISCN